MHGCTMLFDDDDDIYGLGSRLEAKPWKGFSD